MWPIRSNFSGAEASTKDISQAVNPNYFEGSKKVAMQGDNVAKVAMKEQEAKSCKKVVTSLNAKAVLAESKTVKKLFPKKPGN